MIGTYYKTVFRNEMTGETVFDISPGTQCRDTKNGLLRCKGKIGVYTGGMPIALEGELKDGVFLVTRDRLPEKTRENAVNILSYVCKELTDCQKESIADTAMNDLFAFVKRPGCVSLLEGLLKRSPKRQVYARKIADGVRLLSGKWESEQMLLSYRIPIDRIERMVRDRVTLEQIRKNPFMIFLRYDISITVAEVFAARETDITEYSMERLKGFVTAALLRLRENGNTCCAPDDLVREANRLVKKSGVYRTLFDLALVHLCICKMPKICAYHVVRGDAVVYLNTIWEEESEALRNLKRINASARDFSFSPNDADEAGFALGIRYNEGQKNAFGLIRSGGVKILTGPPGSGKTAVIRGLLHAFTRNHPDGKVKLAATTGRAARVMSEACGAKSETVNMALRVIPYDDGAKGRNLNDPVDADLIIVDEVSMLGLQLFSILVQAVKSGAILLLVGDEDQLQSVEYGRVLHDLIVSKEAAVCRLTEILRQSGTICFNAAKINRGDFALTLDETFILYENLNPQAALDLIVKQAAGKNCQVLCPVKGGEIGTVALNDRLQNKTRPVLAEYGKKTFRPGDKIIMTKTDYEAGYVNGDMGRITGAAPDGGLEIEMDAGFRLCLDRESFSNMDLAYAITIHKSQGSEFADAHIVLPAAASHMVTTRLLYTAVTRAKRRVTIYCIGASLREIMRGHCGEERVTMLAKRAVS